MRMGENGFAVVKPDQNGGLDLPAPGGGGGGGGGGSPMSPSMISTVGVPETDPPQTDYDIYDEVTEIKHG